jgi:topoisomerase IA-like protein
MQSGADPNSREYAELAGQRGDYVNARLGRQAEDSKPKYSDAQVRAYMKLHNLTDEKAVRKALGL